MSLSKIISYSNSHIPTSSFSSFLDALAVTHENVCIDKPSLGELNTRIFESTCPIEQVFNHKKDKGKDNYFGSIQDKIHYKKMDKVVDLIPMINKK